MRKQSEQVHSRESSATLPLTVSLFYPTIIKKWKKRKKYSTINVHI